MFPIGKTGKAQNIGLKTNKNIQYHPKHMAMDSQGVFYSVYHD